MRALFTRITVCAAALGAFSCASEASDASLPGPSGAEIAKELFSAPEGDVDRGSIEGLYQAGEDLRVRISRDTITAAYRTDGGALVGVRADVKFTILAQGVRRWEGSIVTSATSYSSPADKEARVTLELQAGTFDLIAKYNPGVITGELPLVITDPNKEERFARWTFLPGIAELRKIGK